jgi:hypothetical protein
LLSANAFKLKYDIKTKDIDRFSIFRDNARYKEKQVLSPGCKCKSGSTHQTRTAAAKLQHR